MKYFVLSDIHGDSARLELALECFHSLGCDVLVLLGDLLYHGPRNPLPGCYAPDRVAVLLNRMRSRIISIRGNCDSEVDAMMFSFPCNAPYGYIYLDIKGALVDSDAGHAGSRRICKAFLTHGHLYHPDTPEALERLGLVPGDLIISGHTHRAGFFELPGGVLNVNPGSVSLPKHGTPAGFAVLDQEGISLYDLQSRSAYAQRRFC